MTGMEFAALAPNRDTVLSAEDARKVARFFQALADPTRVRMLTALAHGEWCVSDLTSALGMDQPAVSHQLKYLREMNVVRWQKHGRHVYYTLGDEHLRDILISSIAHLDCG
ncbi:MAG: metalloregulator ArsR/SmtB family transcription factor [Chloroflexi bacterium]|nr:metalloregulator ArsR/SmtB family transcription factor [Chloroflexota bacterium]MCC6895438.1 winged helix-turn-helix transcriptional regulator [Anaerolineae bacterium]